MGLFDKKYCDVCGEKIGLLGNRKLDDGNICKDCANKLSPWFTGRKKSLLEDIKAQLAYREENAQQLANFRETRVFGSNWKLHIDDNQGVFFVTNQSNWQKENPDLIRFDQVTGCSVDVKQIVHTHTENNQPGGPGGPGGQPGRPGQPGGMGNQPGRPGQPGGMGNQPGHPGQPGGMGGPGASYQTYSYDFDVVINVNGDWFNEIRFRVNPTSVDEKNTAQYQNMNYEAEQIRDALRSLAQNNVAAINAANAPKVSVTCPHCGATTLPTDNGCCEYCGGAIG